MKILINASTLNGGGGIQVALSFMNELKHINKEHSYYIFLSKAVSMQVDGEKFPDNFEFYLIEKSPASMKTRKEVVSQLYSLEEQIGPDVVFTIFGPSYWRPRVVHILGFADGWVYNPRSIAYDRLSFVERMKRRLLNSYKIYYLKRDADYFVLETSDAQNKLAQTLDLDKESTFVVGNTHSSIFNDDKYIEEHNEYYIKLLEKVADEFRLIYIAHNNANKNLKIINKLLSLLESDNVKFVLTLDETSFKKLFPNQTDKIINLGTIPHRSCPSLYRQCDALFAPTLLETFSAAYPEAMKSGKPILTSNYSFAKDICQDTALYFDPLNSEDTAKKIKMLMYDKSLQRTLAMKGSTRVKEFETARSRAEKYISLCEKISKQEKGA